MMSALASPDCGRAAAWSSIITASGWRVARAASVAGSQTPLATTATGLGVGVGTGVAPGVGDGVGSELGEGEAVAPARPDGLALCRVVVVVQAVASTRIA